MNPSQTTLTFIALFAQAYHRALRHAALAKLEAREIETTEFPLDSPIQPAPMIYRHWDSILAHERFKLRCASLPHGTLLALARKHPDAFRQVHRNTNPRVTYSSHGHPPLPTYASESVNAAEIRAIVAKLKIEKIIDQTQHRAPRTPPPPPKPKLKLKRQLLPKPGEPVRRDLRFVRKFIRQFYGEQLSEFGGAGYSPIRHIQIWPGHLAHNRMVPLHIQAVIPLPEPNQSPHPPIPTYYSQPITLITPYPWLIVPRNQP